MLLLQRSKSSLMCTNCSRFCTYGEGIDDSFSLPLGMVLTISDRIAYQLLVTFCSLHVALHMKFFEHKPFDSSVVMGFGVLNGITIGLLNLSLGFNSVGFNQDEAVEFMDFYSINQSLMALSKFQCLGASKSA